MKNHSEYIEAYTASWSYIKNKKTGKAVRMTLEGYGSYTPLHALQDFIDDMPVEEQKEWAERCNKHNHVIDWTIRKKNETK